MEPVREVYPQRTGFRLNPLGPEPHLRNNGSESTAFILTSADRACTPSPDFGRDWSRAAFAQGQSPTSAANPFFGSVTAQPVTSEPLKLSLDDAIQRGLKKQPGTERSRERRKGAARLEDEAIQEFLPTIWLTGRHRLLYARSRGARLRAQDDR